MQMKIAGMYMDDAERMLWQSQDRATRIRAHAWVRGQAPLLYECDPAAPEGLSIADACDILGLDLAEERARLLSLAAMADLSPLFS